MGRLIPFRVLPEVDRDKIESFSKTKRPESIETIEGRIPRKPFETQIECDMTYKQKNKLFNSILLFLTVSALVYCICSIA